MNPLVALVLSTVALGADPVCPTTNVDPQTKAAFQHTPTPRPVTPVQPDGSAACAVAPRDINSHREGEFVFRKPAFFSQLGFTQDGCPIDWNPAIIYEGMRIIFRHDGTYQVHFTVTAPNAPVRLRLQLWGQLRVSNNGWSDSGDTFSITLPPINLAPTTEELRGTHTRTYQVAHEGYSESIRDLWKMGSSYGGFRSHFRIDFTRAGTARFGSYPEPAK